MRQALGLVLTLLLAPLSAQEPRSVASHGLEIHYRLYGTGEPILILGGGPGDVADRYRGLCELLAPGLRCILVEQRGTGKSTPAVQDASTLTVAKTLDDFEAIRVQLGLKQWAVLGFSYGGYLASLYAQRFPERVSGLVLLDSMGLNWDGFGVFQDNVNGRLSQDDQQVIAYWSDPARMNADRPRAIAGRIRAMMPGYFYDRKKSLAASQDLKAADFNFTMGDWIYRDSVEQKLDLAQQKSAYSGPVLVLHGRQDPTGESVPLALSRHYAGSRLVMVEQCGHYSWMEQPETVRAAVVEFIAPRQVTSPTGAEFVLIPSGSFAMGSAGGRPTEQPGHRVGISRPFYLGVYPVTVGQFRRFVQETGYRTTGEKGKGSWIWAGGRDWEQKAGASWQAPGFPQTDEHPVVCVSWHDAKAYCDWLGRKEGRTVRLPTEAEFEYALRAGTTTPWFFGADPRGFEAYGWPQPRTGQGFPSHPVGKKRPNPWGLYDLVGNAWQWCEDWHGPYAAGPQVDPRGPATGQSRVNRGGMAQDPEGWRSAMRDDLPPESDYSNQTFRVVMELIPAPR